MPNPYTILKIDNQSPASQLDDIVELNVTFQKLLGTASPNPAIIRKGLDAMLNSGTDSHVFLLQKNNASVGMCYCNMGSGLACGGKYLWINGIYVDESEREAGGGSLLLQHVIDWAKYEDAVYFMASRHIGNEASEALFKKFKFDQEKQVIMDLEV